VTNSGSNQAQTRELEISLRGDFTVTVSEPSQADQNFWFAVNGTPYGSESFRPLKKTMLCRIQLDKLVHTIVFYHSPLLFMTNTTKVRNLIYKPQFTFTKINP
jgi:hypothetical protein